MTPTTVPVTVPRPPVIAAPPTTTDAITFISSPSPVLLGIWLKRTELTSAARPVSAPAAVNTACFTSAVSMPARRAASLLEPVAYTARPAARLRMPQAIASTSVATPQPVTIGNDACVTPSH